MPSKKYILFLSLLSGVLLGLSWIPSFTFLIFFAFIPFFRIEKIIRKSEIRNKNNWLFWISYLTFFIWNLLATWWVAFASLGGASLAIVCNALLMSLTYLLYLFISKNIKSDLRIFLLIPVWLSFEYFHTDWDLSWTWLSLGNVFAFKPYWIQWYEYTGVSGGTAWVLLANAIQFFLLANMSKLKFSRQLFFRSGIVLIIIFIPIVLSSLRLTILKVFSIEKNKTTVRCLIVQPSYNPYTEKFDIPFEQQLEETKDILLSNLDSSVDYLLLPETFIPHQTWGDEIYENDMSQHPYLKLFEKEITEKYPNLFVVTGADTHYQYGENEERQPTARKFTNAPLYYEAFNTTLQLKKGEPIQIYHKSKLVPGVEMMPFPTLFGLLSDLAIEMGGTSGSLGRQKEREIFAGPKNAKAGTIVCYESVFGEYVTEYINKDANILFILTNDGWWEDTPGYRQHLAYAQLRAIETRRWIARSANTGISAVINPKGEIVQSADWYKKAAILADIPLEDNKTFYVKNGDLISKLSYGLSGLLFITSFIPFFRERKKKK